MARSKVVDTDYYQFLNLLQRAGTAGPRIERSDPRWAQYIKEHGINEVAATAIARQKFEGVVAVIISEGQPTDGLDFSAKNDECCMKLVPIG